MSSIRSIGILTSGGDAPGMNAAVRAVKKDKPIADELIAVLNTLSN